MPKQYEMNEKDIDTILNLLRQDDPEATPEMAIACLEEMYARVHTLSHIDHNLLAQIYEDLKKEQSGGK